MRGLLWCILWLYCSLLCSLVEASWSINPTHIPGLMCDALGFHYTVYLKGDGQRTVKLTALDERGGAHELSSCRDCRTWVDGLPSGSVSLHAFYDGCYVYEENNESVMTVLVEEEYNPGNWSLPERKVLQCPTLGDRSPEHCLVPNVNRTVCASPSVSREGCNNKGCCFDDEDRIGPCYYGNKVTVECSQDGLVSVAISKALTWPPLNLDSMRPMVEDKACKPILRTDGLVLFQLNQSTCGTTSKEIAGLVVYETIMLADIDMKEPSYTSIRLHIQCTSASSDRPTRNTDSSIPSSLPKAIPDPSLLQMRLAEEKRAMDEAASNETILVSSQRPLYSPTTEKTEASRKGSPVLAGPLGKEWVRILLVVCILAAVLVGVYVIKRKPKMSNVEQCV